MNKSIAIVGIPFDANSSFMRGTASAPSSIKEALYSSSANLSTEFLIDISQAPNWEFLEDMDLKGEYMQIYYSMVQLLRGHNRVIVLGGDHSIAFPIAKAYYEKHGPFNVLQLDAHSDLYDMLDGNKYSHGCPFARIMEAGYVKRLVQMGIRCMTPHLHAQAKKFGVEIYEMRNWPQDIPQDWDGPVYISLDLDVLDPAFAPGVAHHEPGGLTTRELLNLIHQINVPLLGAEIVELNPFRDQQGVTAMVAAKLLKEILGKMLSKNI